MIGIRLNGDDRKLRHPERLETEFLGPLRQYGRIYRSLRPCEDADVHYDLRVRGLNQSAQVLLHYPIGEFRNFLEGPALTVTFQPDGRPVCPGLFQGVDRFPGPILAGTPEG